MKSWIYCLVLASVLGLNLGAARAQEVSPCAEVVQKLLKRHQILLDQVSSNFASKESDSYYHDGGFSDLSDTLAMKSIQSDLTLSSIKSDVESAQTSFDKFLKKWKVKSPDCFWN